VTLVTIPPAQRALDWDGQLTWIEAPLAAAVEPLTNRELEVLRLLGTGAANREIAERLSLTEGTVKNYVSAILAKTGLSDRTQAALYAVRRGLTE
jgi:DNA-binding NarL/FixJ family response regulator